MRPSASIARSATRTLARLLAVAALLAAAVVRPAAAQLTDIERRIVERVDANADAAVELLRETVDINSGTLNREGVRRVAETMMPHFAALGFAVRYAELPDSLRRGGHLIAERTGPRGKRLLLIGHLDTVFEEDSPFQRFERDGDTAKGPGVSDMKGGNIALLFALRALHEAGQLDGTHITVVLTGDEERPGRPLDVARRDLIEAGRASDIALGFEAGSHGPDGDLAVIGRRSASSWELTVTGTPAHSSTIFTDGVGSGAIFEAARILAAFHQELKGEANLTFNPGLILGGTEAALDEEASGTAAGKTNIVAERAIVSGDIRTISDAQLERTRERMRAIVAHSLPGTRADITFADGYPAMAPTPANEALLARLDAVSRDLGTGPVRAFDPALRGAADISFVAPYVPGLDGLGPVGSGAHTVDERLDLRTLPVATMRAAVLIHRLTNEPRDTATDR